MLTKKAQDVLNLLQFAHSVKDVALALELDPAKFFFVVQHSETGHYYHSFKIPKRREGFREIDRPKKGMGLAQANLAQVLTSAYTPKPFVKGYVAGESFLSNARYHEGQKWVLNLDIENFFGSIGFARVRGLFLSRYFGFNSRVATILARVTTFNDRLPQGSPTSPIIANIIAYNLDKYLVSIAAQERLRFTRYADDISFSSSQRKVPPSLVRSWEPLNGDREIKLGPALANAFEQSRFRVNKAKTRIQFAHERQEVTGLIVNKRANIRRKDISRLRLKIHSAKKFGAESAAKVWISPTANAKDYWNHIEGWLSYIRQVRGHDDIVLAKLCKSAVIAGSRGVEWIERQAEMVREFDVFLSHASEDKPRVRLLKERLDKLGLNVFFDEDSIEWGDSIVEKINHGLLKSSFFVPFLSESFSIKGWTNKELNSAIGFNVGRKGRILPIVDQGFSVEENYPLLNETLYKQWPAAQDETSVLDAIADELLKKVETEKLKAHDLD